MTEIAGDGFVGVRTERGDELDLVMFRAGGANGTMRYGDWATDALACTVTQSGERLKLFAVQNSRSLMRAARGMFASDNPASIAANYTANGVEVACYAMSATKIQLFAGSSPARALLDGREVAVNYNRADATISLTIPAGQHQLKIELH